MFTKSDLKDGDIITYRNGNRRIVCQDKYHLRGFEKDDNGLKIDDFREDLTDEDNVTDFDIVKVERPCQYKKVYERTEKLTIAQAEKKFEQLGHNIKII